MEEISRVERGCGVIYLSPTTSIPDRTRYGIMFSANHQIGGQREALDSGVRWAMDNNQFTDDFTPVRWYRWLDKLHKYAGQCVCIPIPDVVGDCLATLRQFELYAQIVRDYGYPVAFVSQNGLTPMMTPWDNFDVLFVGGDDKHKLRGEAAILIAEAKARGKWVHVGRVNSASRIKRFYVADSCDGSGLIYDGANDRAKRFDDYSAAIDYCNNRKSGVLGVDSQYKMEVAL